VAKIKDLDKWIVEITESEKFREEEFGILTQDKRYKAGENIEYFERGYYDNLNQSDAAALGMDTIATLNLIDAVASVVTPALYQKNPKTIANPKRVESEDTAMIAAKTVDHFRKVLNVQDVNKKVIWDTYVLGYGVYKAGYVTKFGKDIPDEEKQKEREKAKTLREKVKEFLHGPKEKEEEIRTEDDIRIVAESPFVEYVNPFDFGIDPRATSIYDARFVYQRVRKTVKEMKENKKYKNTDQIDGDDPEIRSLNFTKVSGAEQEDFRTVNVYEIHYRNGGNIYILVVSEGNGKWLEHYHEVTAYDMGEWQYDILTFKKHGHSLYPRSDITKMKALQDRITRTIDSILEQVDKFIPKIAYDDTGVTETGKKGLKSDEIGAMVACNKNPNEVFRELNLTQLKADLQRLLDQLISLVSIQTGLTRAQLLGATSASTATEAQIEQGGQTLRLGDMSEYVREFVNRQSQKMWKIIGQFTPLEQLELINGIKGIDEQTGQPKYNWLVVDDVRADRLRNGEYDFDMETGSTERINLAMVRKSFENLFNIVARPEVVMLMQQQGSKVPIADFLGAYVELFPELGVDKSKLIQKIGPQTTGLLPPEPSGPGGQNAGSSTNQLRSQMAEGIPNVGNITNSVY
jgi:hypothetical protein